MSSLIQMPRLPHDDATLTQTLDVLARQEQLRRRRFLAALGGMASAAVLLPMRGLACSLIPAETGGPYPGDGTNGPNVLTQSGIVRADIRSSFGSAGTTQAAGTLLLVTLKLVSSTDGCVPLSGLAVYLWHCNAVGGYSLYSSGITTQNYLRGVQVSNDNGEVTFMTVFPGCYPGRWPHIHFEVYSSLASATSGSNAVRTSQLALPETQSRAVYSQPGTTYGSSTQNINGVTLQSDNVFGNDGGVLQIATTTGSVAAGYEAVLEVGVPLAPSAPVSLFANGYE